MKSLAWPELKPFVAISLKMAFRFTALPQSAMAKARPVTDNRTKAGRAKNRRVVIQVLE